MAANDFGAEFGIGVGTDFGINLGTDALIDDDAGCDADVVIAAGAGTD